MKKILAAVLMLAFAIPACAAGGIKASKESTQLIVVFGQFFAAWNKHDVNAMLAFWTDDATLINPMGQAANGKAELEKLFTEEQTGGFKRSTAKLGGLTTHPLADGLAWYDAEMTIDNATAPDGANVPQMKLHIAGLMQKKAGKWRINAARPYAFMTPPPAN